MSEIYCVVAIRVTKASWACKTHEDCRTWGWYPSIIQARAAVRKSSKFIHEMGFYQFCLIERVPSGICTNAQAMEWFLLKGERYVRTARPKWALQICNWSMG